MRWNEKTQVVLLIVLALALAWAGFTLDGLYHEWRWPQTP